MTIAKLKVKKVGSNTGLLTLGSRGGLLSCDEIITNAGFKCCDEVIVMTQEHYDDLMDDNDIDDPEDIADENDDENDEDEETIPTTPKNIVNNGVKK